MSCRPRSGVPAPGPLPTSLVPATAGLRRRHWLAGAAAGLVAGPALSQRAGPPAARAEIEVAQVADMSPAQQDISRDFIAGSRAAWQEFNLAGGLQGRPVRHRVLETDGSAAALAQAWNGVRRDPQCVLLSGTTGHGTAQALATLVRAGTREGSPALAHVAPWLLSEPQELDPLVFPVFASRQEQIGHALRSLSVVGVAEIGVVYATPQDRAQYQGGVERAAAGLRLATRTVAAEQPAASPAIVLFVGGTPELVRFCQVLARIAGTRQQFVVALADANLQTLALSGAPAHVPVIGTQPVPVVTASLPVVRQFREVLARFFDEPPTPHSLAGFLAARYTIAVLRAVDGPPSRASVLAALARRPDIDLGGFRVAGAQTGNTYVTQSMLTRDGRLVG